jgi:hypothetical protein
MCDTLGIARQVAVSATATPYRLPAGYVWRDLRIEGDLSIVSRVFGSSEQWSSREPPAPDTFRAMVEGFDFNPSALSSPELRWRGIDGSRIATLVITGSTTGSLTLIGVAARPCGCGCKGRA